MPDTTLRYAPGHPVKGQLGERHRHAADEPSSTDWYDSYPYDVRPITDDGPFFWHFTPFGDVIAHFGEPIDRSDFEDARGERVLLLLLGIATLFAAVFLLLPFLRDPQHLDGASAEAHGRRSTSRRSGWASCSSRSR